VHGDCGGGHTNVPLVQIVPGCYEDIEAADLVSLLLQLCLGASGIVSTFGCGQAGTPTMQVVVVDPRRTPTCDIADLHLAIAPAQMPICLMVCCIICARRCINLNYVEAHVERFLLRLGSSARRWLSAKVAQVCGVAESHISEFFRLFARTERW